MTQQNENEFNPGDVEVHTGPISQTPGVALQVAQDFDLEKAVSRAEKGATYQKRLTTAAIRATNENCWCDFEGTPIPEHKACKAIAHCFGVKYRQTKPSEREYLKDAKGEYIMARVTLEASLWGASVEGIGICTTRDKLLGRKDHAYRPLEDVDLANVELKAYSSAFRHATQNLLGLYPTWDDLKAAGLDVDAIRSGRSVKHQRGSQGGSTASQEEKDARQHYWMQVLEFCNGDENAAKDWLEKITGFKATDGVDVKGKRDINRISGKQWEYTAKKIETVYTNYQEHLKKQAAQDQQDAPTGTAQLPEQELQNEQDKLPF